MRGSKTLAAEGFCQTIRFCHAGERTDPYAIDVVFGVVTGLDVKLSETIAQFLLQLLRIVATDKCAYLQVQLEFSLLRLGTGG